MKTHLRPLVLAFVAMLSTTQAADTPAAILSDYRKDITGHSSAAMNERYTHRAASTLANALKRAINLPSPL